MPNPISTPPVKVNVGCGRNPLPGWINIDSRFFPGVEIVQNLEGCDHGCIGLKDDTVDEFLLSHVLEHIHDTLGLMQELHRMAKPGAKAVVRCPYGSSDDAWEDQTHVRPYFIKSFCSFAQPYYWRADYRYRGDWRVKKITLILNPGIGEILSRAEIGYKISTGRNVVQEMIAELEAVKPIREPRKELQESLNVEIVGGCIKFLFGL